MNENINEIRKEIIISVLVIFIGSYKNNIYWLTYLDNVKSSESVHHEREYNT